MTEEERHGPNYYKNRDEVRERYNNWTLEKSSVRFLKNWAEDYPSASRSIDGLVNAVEAFLGESRLAVRVEDLIWHIDESYPPDSKITLAEVLQFFAKEKR